MKPATKPFHLSIRAFLNMLICCALFLSLVGTPQNVSANPPLPASGSTFPAALDQPRSGPYHETRFQPSSPATDVGGKILSNTTWTKANSPYVVISDVLVDPGVTLTIEPGVTVQFAHDLGLYVSGTLLAAGTYADPIHFTGTALTPGWWADISIEGTPSVLNTSSRFSYVSVKYAGSRLSRPGSLYLRWASAAIDHSQFNHGFYSGIYGAAMASADIIETSFSDNGNGDTTEDYALWFTDGSANPSLAHLTFSGNSGNNIALGGGALTTRDWTNAGAPYVITGDLSVPLGATLTVAAGVTVLFKQKLGLFVYGQLISAGSPTRGVTFTATNPVPGWWAGISILGDPSAPNEGSRLDYTTISYGGSSITHPADLYLFHAKTALAHSQLLNSSAAGLEASYADGSVIELGQIAANAGPGIQNDTDSLLIAAYNWWGSSTGTAQAACNPGGTGNGIVGVVNFKPFLTSPGQDPGPVPALSAPSLLIEPQRFFTPADGVSQLWVTLTLRDVDGSPLPGRTLTLNSSLGSPTSGGLTDIQGRSYAYLTSSTPGDAILSATIGGIDPCEKPLASASKVTFTSQPDNPYMPAENAPYFNQYLDVRDQPVLAGVPNQLSATLFNPNAFPITVDASFSYAQSNIGLVFGPLGDVNGVSIPANSQVTISIPWTPPVSGHYCIRLQYTVTPSAVAPSAVNAYVVYKNVVAGESGASSAEEAHAALEAIKALAAIDGDTLSLDLFSLPGAIPPPPPINYSGYSHRRLVGVMKWENIVLKRGFNSRSCLEYTQYAMPAHYTFSPLQPEPGMSAARAAALNSLVQASLDLTADLQAAALSSARYSDASAAGDLTWAPQQMAALLYYKKLAGTQMLLQADRINAVNTEIHAEGIQDLILAADTVRASQAVWASTGVPLDEKQSAQSIGISDADIEAMRQAYIQDDPNKLAGSVLDHMAHLADAMRVLGNLWIAPPNFQGALPAAAQLNALAAFTPNQLGRFYQTTTTFQLGNPLSAQANITLSLRPVDLPPDWMVTLTPSSGLLNPGQQTTVTVTIDQGSVIPQGVQPRLAVEGYANGQLLGGVVIDVLVPRQGFFDGKLRVYLPVVKR